MAAVPKKTLANPAATATFRLPPKTYMRDEYLKEANKVIPDPNILINVVSRRVKQLKSGMEPLYQSLEKLETEDIALKEIIEGRISYELYTPAA
jgi:DNA-directed RNA polymerase subunit omega